MKKLLKIAVACTLCMALALSFAGCSEKTLKMGTNAAFPPYEYKGSNGVEGIDVDIANKIAKTTNQKLVVNDMEFGSLINAVNSGKVDFVAAGMTVTPDREKQVDFSTKYCKATQVVIVKKDNTAITGKDSLKDKKIGVQQGTTGNDDAKEISGAKVASYNSGLEAVMDLKNGKIDAVIIDADPAKAFVNKNSDLKMIEGQFPDEYYAIAVKKGNKALLKKINQAIKELKDSGELDKIVEKYATK